MRRTHLGRIQLNIIGIDPGVSGGLAHIHVHNGKMTYLSGMRMPVRQLGPKVTVVDALAAVRWFQDEQIATSWAEFKIPFNGVDAIVLERVSSMPGQGVASTFTFGRAMGAIEAVAQVMAHDFECRVNYASPSVWKKAMHLSKNKQASMDMAMHVFGHNDLWKVKANDGIAEAALMAAWHYRQHAHVVLD